MMGAIVGISGNYLLTAIGKKSTATAKLRLPAASRGESSIRKRNRGASHRSLVLLQAAGDVPAGEFSGPEVNVVLADNIQRSQQL